MAAVDEGKMARTILHLHIPRTAGSSLHKLLLQHGPTLSGDTREVLKTKRDEVPWRFGLVTGHFRFGVHDLFPDYVYFIVLRDPVERVWSLIRFILSTPSHPYYSLVRECDGDPRYIYLRQPRGGQFDNGMVRQLCYGRGKPSLSALAALSRPDVIVAPLENISIGLSALGQRIGYRFEGLGSQNSAPKEDLPSLWARTIYEHNLLDARLYDACRRRFAHQSSA